MTFREGSTGYTINDFAIVTAVLPVAACDWFHLRVNYTSPYWNAVLANSRSRFALELIETADAAGASTGLRPGQVVAASGCCARLAGTVVLDRLPQTALPPCG